jgi:hypothetical protein
MSSLERMLLENMLRFSPKNLNSRDQRKLKQLLKEQITEAPNSGSTTYSPSDSVAEIIRVEPADWGINGFTPPAVASSDYFAVESGETQIKNRPAQWMDAYETYLDGATGYVGKTLLIFKGQNLDPREIVEKITIQASFNLAYDEKSFMIWTAAATKNFDKASNVMVVAANATPKESGYFTGAYDVSGEYGLVTANLKLVPDEFEMTPAPGASETAPCVLSLTLKKGETLPVKLRGSDYSVNYKGEVRKAGQLIGYTPAHPYTSVASTADGFGFTLAAGKSVTLQDSDNWYTSFKPAGTNSKKR